MTLKIFFKQHAIKLILISAPLICLILFQSMPTSTQVKVLSPSSHTHDSQQKKHDKQNYADHPILFFRVKELAKFPLISLNVAGSPIEIKTFPIQNKQGETIGFEKDCNAKYPSKYNPKTGQPIGGNESAQNFNARMQLTIEALIHAQKNAHAQIVALQEFSTTHAPGVRQQLEKAGLCILAQDQCIKKKKGKLTWKSTETAILVPKSEKNNYTPIKIIDEQLAIDNALTKISGAIYHKNNQSLMILSAHAKCTVDFSNKKEVNESIARNLTKTLLGLIKQYEKQITTQDSFYILMAIDANSHVHIINQLIQQKLQAPLKNQFEVQMQALSEPLQQGKNYYYSYGEKGKFNAYPNDGLLIIQLNKK
ncbi:MAG: hypothetical protein AAF380_02745 [Bacteroidota bacterium]